MVEQRDVETWVAPPPPQLGHIFRSWKITPTRLLLWVPNLGRRFVWDMLQFERLTYTYLSQMSMRGHVRKVISTMRNDDGV